MCSLNKLISKIKNMKRYDTKDKKFKVLRKVAWDKRRTDGERIEESYTAIDPSDIDF